MYLRSFIENVAQLILHICVEVLVFAKRLLKRTFNQICRESCPLTFQEYVGQGDFGLWEKRIKPPHKRDFPNLKWPQGAMFFPTWGNLCVAIRTCRFFQWGKPGPFQVKKTTTTTVGGIRLFLTCAAVLVWTGLPALGWRVRSGAWEGGICRVKEG